MAYLGLLLSLLIVCCFAPGFFLVRKLRWSPLEKLCGAVGLSLVLVYLAAWAVYCLSSSYAATIQTPSFVLVSLICAGLGAAAWRDIVRLARNSAVRRALLGFAFLLVWTFTLLAMIRVYSGAGWFGDWLEHFQRSLFFIYHYPANTTIFPKSLLPARPPMMNVLAAFFLEQTKDRFEFFQVIFTFINLLLFLPCCLIMPALGMPGKRRTLLLVTLFAMSPVIMENATYSWTKAAAAFYVILAFSFYLAGWRKGDRLRTTAAFVFLAAGLLAHYSAGPYVVFLTAHYLWRIFPKRTNKWKELAGIAASSGFLLLTWFGWALATYGPRGTFLSNTAVTSSQAYNGSTPAKISLNLVDTLVPNLLRNPPALKAFDQPSAIGFLRDRFFILYQLNLVFTMGLIGGPLVLWLLSRVLRGHRAMAVTAPAPQPKRHRGQRSGRARGKAVVKVPTAARVTPGRQRGFWLAAILCCVLLGVAVVGERDTMGVPHLTLLPLTALGLALLAAAVPWQKKTLAAVVILGCLADFSLGVFLNARVESEENSSRRTVFGTLTFQGGQFGEALPPDSLSSTAWENWYRKHLYALTQRWLQEMPRQHGADPAFQEQWPMAKANLEGQRLAWARDWYGWWDRNGGEIQFLGDHLAGSDGGGTTIATAVLLSLAGALIVTLLLVRSRAVALAEPLSGRQRAVSARN